MHQLSAVGGGFGVVLRDAAFVRTGFAASEDGPTLACAAAPKWLRAALAAPGVAALVTSAELAPQVPERLGLLVAEDPEIAFHRLHNHLARAHGMRTVVAHAIDPSAEIDPSALVETGVRIGPGCRVGPRAVVQAGTILEEGATVGVGALVGVEGRYVKRRPGLLLRVAQVGGVHVGREAEIEAGAIVQREVHPGFTRIGARAVIGVGAGVSHGVDMGPEATLAVGATVCGYVRIGAGAWIGPGAVVTDSVEIGAGARVEIGAVAVRDVPAGARWSGVYAGPHRRMMRLSMAAGRGDRPADEGA